MSIAQRIFEKMCTCSDTNCPWHYAQNIRAFLQEFYAQTEVNPFNKQEHVWRAKAVFAVQVSRATGGQLVWLSSLRSVQRGLGYGTEALAWLTELAQRHRVALAGLVQPCGQQQPQLTRQQLKAWYTRHGFIVQPDGRMYKLPKETNHDDHTPRSPITKG